MGDEQRQIPESDEQRDLVVVGAEETSAQDDRVAELVEASATPAELAPAVQEQDAPDAADILEDLEREETIEVIRLMEDESAAEALSHMDPALAATILLDSDRREAARYLALMEPDDAADLLQQLPTEEASSLLRAMPAQLAAELGKLAQYASDSAGGLMTTDVVALPARMRIREAIEFLRRDPVFSEPESAVTYVYCVGEDDVLVGVLPLRAMVLSRPDSLVEDSMLRSVDAIRPDLDQEEVARAFERYDYLSLPVVDERNRLLGMVTIDDVIDIIQEEQTEDAQLQVGAGRGENISSPVREKLRGRFPWLTVNLGTALAASFVVLAFEELIAQIVFLAVMLPVIANQSGNAGQQSLAVTLRGIVLGEVRKDRVVPLVWRETLSGVVSGAAIGLLLLGAATIVGHFGLIEGVSWRLGLVGGAAMAGAVTIGCFVGSVTPIVMQRLGFDPATASTIFLIMITDAFSFFTLLSLAHLLRNWLLG